MARLEFFAPFSMRDDRDFISGSQEDILAGGSGQFSSFSIVNAGRGSNVTVNGRFAFNTIGERTGDIKSINGGQIIPDEEEPIPDDNTTADFFSLEYTVTNLNSIALESLDRAILTGDALNVWSVIADQSDRVIGSAEADELFAFAGDDKMSGRRGDDLLQGGRGDDTLIGGTGSDTLKGADDNDILRGKAGADRVEGGAGDDMLKGNKGADTLVGGAGDDTLLGGGGSDLFVFDADDGADVVQNFTDGKDLFQAVDATGFDDLAITTSGADALITFGATTVLVEDTSAADLTADDFIFA